MKSDLSYTFTFPPHEPTLPTATPGRVASALCRISARARWNPRQMDRLSVPMKVRQQRLGHGDASITLGIYTHTVGEDSLAVATQLGRIIWSQSLEILDANGRKLKTA